MGRCFFQVCLGWRRIRLIFNGTDFNRIIEIKAREKYRVKLFMEMIDQSQKTVVFCATQNCALAVRDLVNQMKKKQRPKLLCARDGQ